MKAWADDPDRQERASILQKNKPSIAGRRDILNVYTQLIKRES